MAPTRAAPAPPPFGEREDDAPDARADDAPDAPGGDAPDAPGGDAPGAPGGDALDAALLRRALAGEGAAARALAARRGPALVALARRLLGDASEAEDAAQEAFLRLWRAAPDFSAPGAGSVGGWLRRTARNLCLDRLRRRGRLTAIDDAAEPLDGAPHALERLAEADRAAALAAALDALPARQRAAVTLRHLEGMSNPEIAAALGAGVEAVESLLARGRRRLAALLAAHREDGR